MESLIYWFAYRTDLKTPRSSSRSSSSSSNVDNIGSCHLPMTAGPTLINVLRFSLLVWTLNAESQTSRETTCKNSETQTTRVNTNIRKLRLKTSRANTKTQTTRVNTIIRTLRLKTSRANTKTQTTRANTNIRTLRLKTSRANTKIRTLGLKLLEWTLR